MSKKNIGLWLGPSLFFLILFCPRPENLSLEGQKTAALAVLMACWWMTEALPLAATSLLPIALFPLLGISSAKNVSMQYSQQLIFLFMAGFMIALSMQRWNLHKRIALFIISLVGLSPKRLIFGFMVATALLSAFISNTATAVMMLPIAISVATKVDEDSSSPSLFSTQLMLGIAYSASIGGVATIIGTPPNLAMISFLQQDYQQIISMRDWAVFGFPFALIFLSLTWLILTYPIQSKHNSSDIQLDVMTREKKALGTMHPAEKITLIVFLCVACLWAVRTELINSTWAQNHFPWLKTMLLDSTIAIGGAILLFAIPIKDRQGVRTRVLTWEWAQKLPWGILILFGGGLALANGFKVTGLSTWIGEQLKVIQHLDDWVLIVCIVTLVVFLTEITSNTATTYMLMPILGSIAVSMGKDPTLFIIPAALAASCAFMLPVATPPNAIVFGSGKLTMNQMMKAGLGLNLLSIILISIAGIFILPKLFGS